jgi:hypothetical protein
MLFLAGDLTQWHLPVGMQKLDLYYTEVTGKAQRLSEGHFPYLLRPAALASSFLTLYFFPLFAFPSAGDIGNLVLPVGMQIVDFTRCAGITGTAKLGRRFIFIYYFVLAASRTRFLIPHFILFPLFAFPFARCCRQDRAPRGHAVSRLLRLRGHHRYV